MVNVELLMSTSHSFRGQARVLGAQARTNRVESESGARIGANLQRRTQLMLQLRPTTAIAIHGAIMAAYTASRSLR